MIEWFIFLAKLRNKEKKNNTESGCRKQFHYREQFNAEYTSCIIQERNSENAVPLYLFLVIHHLNIMKRIAI